MSSEKNFDHSIAIVGQTNTGKSTLINKLCKSEISIASSKPFLTLDPVEGQFMSGEKTFRIFDTAGMILNSNKKTKIDKVANFETDRKIRLSEIILILMDINNYWEKSNKRIIKKVLDESRCTILVINKIDTKDKFSESYIKEQIFKDLPSVKDFSIFFVSAKKGQGIDKLKKYLSESLLKWSKRIETSKLNKWLKDTLNINPPPLFNGKHIKLKYISQISSKPPKFKIFSNIPRGIKENYKKYLINNLQYLSKSKITEVTSPTFNIMNEYNIGDLLIKHYDLFRLKSSDELEDLNLFDENDKAVLLIEWPQIIKKKLNLVTKLYFEYENEYQNRTVKISN